MAHILVVDDDAAIRFTLEELLRKQGHETTSADSGEAAVALLEDADLIITDLAMPGMDGLELLRVARERVPSVPVILLTAFGSERIAVNAIKAGAYDYVAKPFDNDELRHTVRRALETVLLKRENQKLFAERTLGCRFIAESPAMLRLLDAVARVAARHVTVLVRGETGSGKEMIASLIHAQSQRASAPFVRFNCAALPDDLAEAELFGHVKGAFTGAYATRRGYFAEADGGTLVLDEVGELTGSIQAKLLRAVQEGEVQQLGSSQVVNVDVRLVACTNRNLAEEVTRGTFREDLFYRLAVVEFVVPPLRDRTEDIVPLACEFARRYAERFALESDVLPESLTAQLARMPWPGNVRQLENTIARLAALSHRSFADADLDMLELPSSSGSATSAERGPPSIPPGASLKDEVEAFEKQLLAQALQAADGNMSEAARQLSIGRATLFDKVRKYGLDPSGRPKKQ